MAWRVLFYCLRVWFSALLVGTVLLETFTRGDNFKFIVFMLLVGSAYSIPSLLLAWIVSFLIIRTSGSRRAKRLWIAVLAVPLVVLPFIIALQGDVEYDWQSMFRIAGLYYLPILAGIFFYSLPEPHAVHV
jgi:hypothetical protein